jgi:hypothetical protein
MIRLVYSGSAVASLRPEEVGPRLTAFRQHAIATGCSGVLVLMGKDFLQVLEGSDDIVDAHYARMLARPGDYQITLLARETIQRRLFKSWTLGVIPSSPQNIHDLLPVPTIPPDPVAARTLRLIEEFVAGKWHHHGVLSDNPQIVHRH